MDTILYVRRVITNSVNDNRDIEWRVCTESTFNQWQKDTEKELDEWNYKTPGAWSMRRSNFDTHESESFPRLRVDELEGMPLEMLKQILNSI